MRHAASSSSRIAKAFDELSLLVERMKAAGLPGNEASHLRAFAAVAGGEWEAFARIYTLLHPGFMAPYYAHVAGTVSANAAVSLAFALGLGCATSLCLSALFSARYN
jgi:hypothetical protein